MIQVNPAMLLVRHKAIVSELYKSGKAILKVFDGAIPVAPTIAPTGRLIATVYTKSATAPVVTTTTTAIDFDDGLIAFDSTPTFARLYCGDGTVVLDATIGAESSSEPLKYSTADFYLGGLMKVTSLYIKEG
ncbi:MAG: hypothetical protein RR280_04325 [Bacteroidaceae bacterium]